MKQAFVTGATGFVGAAVARALVAAGWQVRALARAGSDRRNLSGLPIEVVTGDLRDPASYAPALAGLRGRVSCGRRLPAVGAEPG